MGWIWMLWIPTRWQKGLDSGPDPYSTPHSEANLKGIDVVSLLSTYRAAPSEALFIGQNDTVSFLIEKIKIDAV